MCTAMALFWLQGRFLLAPGVWTCISHHPAAYLFSNTYIVNARFGLTGRSRCVFALTFATLTLLLTSLSFGRMSKVKPSACPRDRFPPFMKLPKASTRPSTCNTASPLWRVWRRHRVGGNVGVGLTQRKKQPAGDSPYRLAGGFQFYGELRWCIHGKLTGTGCRTPVRRNWGFVITGTETW